MLGTKWNNEHWLRLRTADKQSADRLIEIKRILGEAETPVKYICIYCRKNPQKDRTTRKCGNCLRRKRTTCFTST